MKIRLVPLPQETGQALILMVHFWLLSKLVQ